jgi:hypothetical protein
VIRILALLSAAFLLAAPSTGTHLVFGPGVHTPAQTVFTAADGPVTIQCAGPTQTVLMVPTGFDITYDSEFTAPTIEGCTLATDGQGGTALTITGPLLPSSTQHGPRIRDVSIRGELVQSKYFAKGIRLVDVWNPILRDINVKGKDQPVPDFLMLTCVEFERSQVVDIEKLDCYHVQTAVKQLGATYGEGFSLRDFNFVGVKRGIELTFGAGYVIADGHINAFLGCAKLAGKPQIVIDGVLCYKTHTSTSDFVGFHIVGAQQVVITNTRVEGSSAATESGYTTGFVLSNVWLSQLTGNSCTNMKTHYGACIVVGSLSHDNILIGNFSLMSGMVAVRVNPDAGVNNYVSGNVP